MDDVALTELSFGRDYSAAIESKQVAQQEAQRAAFIVDRAIQEKQQKIVQAEGNTLNTIFYLRLLSMMDSSYKPYLRISTMSNLILGEAKAAEMLGEAISKNPGYLKLRKLRASGTIAKTVRVYLFLVHINTVGSTCVYNPRKNFSTLELNAPSKYLSLSMHKNT